MCLRHIDSDSDFNSKRVQGIRPVARSRIAGNRTLIEVPSPIETMTYVILQDAEIHFFGMKVDSAIKFVLFGVKSHLVSSFFIGLWFFGETHNTIF